MGGVQLERLLEQLHRGDELLVEGADARGEPERDPIARRQSERLLEAIVRTGFLAGEQHVPACEPDVGRVAALFDGGVGEGDGFVQFAAAAKGDRLGGKQLGLTGKCFQGFVGPEGRFPEFAELDQCAHLTRPGGHALRVELQRLGTPAQGFLELTVLERLARAGKEVGLGLGRFALPEFALELPVKLQISEPAHGCKS